MNNLLVYYEGNKSSHLEEKANELVVRYGGKVVSEFAFERGSHCLMASFNHQGQENNFKKDILIVAKALNINMEFGGAVFDL